MTYKYDGIGSDAGYHASKQISNTLKQVSKDLKKQQYSVKIIHQPKGEQLTSVVNSATRESQGWREQSQLWRGNCQIIQNGLKNQQYSVKLIHQLKGQQLTSAVNVLNSALIESQRWRAQSQKWRECFWNIVCMLTVLAVFYFFNFWSICMLIVLTVFYIFKPKIYDFYIKNVQRIMNQQGSTILCFLISALIWLFMQWLIVFVPFIGFGFYSIMSLIVALLIGQKTGDYVDSSTGWVSTILCFLISALIWLFMQWLIVFVPFIGFGFYSIISLIVALLIVHKTKEYFDK